MQAQDGGQRVARLRAWLCESPGREVWEGVMALFAQWPQEEGLSAALEYAQEHLQAWPEWMRCDPSILPAHPAYPLVSPAAQFLGCSQLHRAFGDELETDTWLFYVDNGLRYLKGTRWSSTYDGTYHAELGTFSVQGEQALTLFPEFRYRGEFHSDPTDEDVSRFSRVSGEFSLFFGRYLGDWMPQEMVEENEGDEGTLEFEAARGEEYLREVKDAKGWYKRAERQAS